MGLESLVRAELAGEAPDACTELAKEIHQRYGASLVAILFYGSCLRDESLEGMLDFYAIVDDYRRAYPSPLLAWANAALPPNVFYLERRGQRAKVAVLNERRRAEERPVTSVYVGLHIGAVFYGNVGSDERLDFTVVGPAVNETSRIASMCRSVDRPLLISSDFADCLPSTERGRLVSVGRFALRGVGHAKELFTLDPQLVR